MTQPLNVLSLLVLNDLRDHVYDVAASKGFHDPDQDALGMPKYVANLHGEVSELWEAFRAGTLDKPCNKADKMKAAGLPVLTCAEEEIADILIRALDVARVYNIDVANAVAVKDAFNQRRPHRHGGKKA
jgi:NTP pyrophosphatase (non-canonical NTP hydrolase)